MTLFALPPSDGVTATPVVLQKFTAPLPLGSIEPVGRAYRDICVAKFGKEEVAEDETTFEQSTNSEEHDTTSIDLQEVEEAELDDFYSLLGLAEKDVFATVDEIKGNYRKVALMMHPDKNPLKPRVETEARYKAIGEAREILCDPVKRRLYDSKRDFDESIPSDEDEESFYEVFAPVFKRNAKFSMKHPVPELGDDNSSDDHVSHFYDSWFAFRSWRDFSFLGDHKIEQANGRDEKRWMMRENKTVANKAAKVEAERIRELVDTAHGIDPRVKRARRREKEEKEEKKRQRQKKKEQEKWEKESAVREAAEARKKEEATRAEREAADKKSRATLKQKKKEQEKWEKESAVREAAEARKKEEATRAEREAADKKSRATLKQEKKKLRSAIRKVLASDFEGQATDVEITSITEFSVEQLRNSLEDLQKGSKAVFDGAITALKGCKATQARLAEQHYRQAEAARKQRARSPKSSKSWQHEELSALSKAVQKFPGGTPERWKRIAAFLGTNRSDKECIAKSKELAKSGADRVAGKAAFDTYKKDLTKLKQAKSGQKGEQKTEESKENGPTPDHEDDWTVDQQAALENALKRVAALEKVRRKPFPRHEKWTRISDMVGGKSKKECVHRFKIIREKILAKKAATESKK
eukprot:47768_1